MQTDHLWNRPASWIGFGVLVISGVMFTHSSARAGDGVGVLSYSNTQANLFFAPGQNRRIADDLTLAASCNCNLDRYSFKVSGNGDGTGSGFIVTYGLYDGCPNGGGTLIPGTQGISEFADDNTYIVTHVNEGDPIQMPQTFWLAVEFNNTVGGWFVGEPPELGFSDDVYDFPTFPCTADVATLFASFDAQVYCLPSEIAPAENPIPNDGATHVVATPVLSWNATPGPDPNDSDDEDGTELITADTFVDATRHPDFYLNELQRAIAAGEIEDPSKRPFPELPPRQEWPSIAGFGAPPVTQDDFFLFEDTDSVLANPFSTGQALGLMGIATVELLEEYGDNYDFVAFFLNYAPDPGSQIGGAFYSGLTNDVTGIGLTPFDNLQSFGIVSEQLEGWVMMWNQANWPTSQTSITQLVLGQEFEHRFAMFLASLADGRRLQGLDDGFCGRSAHWNFRVDGQGSGMEIAEWVGENPAQWNGQILSYNTDIPGSVFSYPDLYLMGYVSGEEMDANSSELRYMDDNPTCVSSYDGPISTFDSSDIVATNGVRTPGSILAQKHFRTAWIVIHLPNAPPTQSQYGRMITMLNHWNDTWVVSTLGRGTMTNVLEPPDPCDPTYDVYVDTVNPPTELVCGNHVAPTCEPGLLLSDTTHYWQVVTQQPGGMADGPIWSFTTEPCGSPDSPDSPSPEDGTIGVDLVSEVSWNNAGPSGGEFCATTYDVYLSQDNPPTTLLWRSN